MANTTNEVRDPFNTSEQLRISNFHVDGLFGSETISIKFPPLPENKSEASILILQGRNGTGKTTVLKMIGGMLELDFDMFRQFPFSSASLSLSNGNVLGVKWLGDVPLSIEVTFAGLTACLAMDKEGHRYSPPERLAIDAFRERALPIMGGINYELLSVDRTPVDEQRHVMADGRMRTVAGRDEPTLAQKVKRFIREAQLNHRRYFRSEELSILPSILERMRSEAPPPTQSELHQRILAVSKRAETTGRLGLQTDKDDLAVIANALLPNNSLSERQLAIVEPYVAMQESGQTSRDLIAQRLIEFERIMDDFLVGKKITVGADVGLRISTPTKMLSEASLSSGEFHFLYMMVSALLCQRVGSIIAIDEPELSLHLSWQRKLLSALSRCSAGASPLFICATHSVAISAEHADKVQVLSAVE